MSISVVIGANYGDEGKGLVTDYLVFQSQPNINNVAVVRFNGGAQAGHTVELNDGTKHVFSHIGSGTFLGADTILSDYFVLNPKIFRREVEELSPKVNKQFQIFGCKKSPITTPYEVLINRAIETRRGKNKHGSVGVGFGETIARHENNVIFTVEQCSRHDLKNVETWFWGRLKYHNIQTLTYGELEMISERSINQYFEDLSYMLINITWYSTHSQVVDGYYQHLIFEGAQGLLLDMDYGEFPYVTRSNTGLKNVIDIVGQVDMDVYYVTRPYLTRHGAGPLKDEIFDHQITDETNQPSQWQEKLRVAPLDVKELNGRCRYDLCMHNPDNAKMHYAVTWSHLEQSKDIYNATFADIIYFNDKTRNV